MTKRQEMPNLSSVQNPEHRKLVRLVIEEAMHGDNEFLKSATEAEKDIVAEWYDRFLLSNDLSPMKALEKIDYIEPPVSITQFVEDPEYMGTVGKDLYPVWKNELIKLFGGRQSVNEVIVTGAIGTGKTTFAIIALLFKAHILFCLRNPVRYFGLMQGMSSMVFGLFNMTMTLSQNVHYAKLKDAMWSSPYFRFVATGAVEEFKDRKGQKESEIFHLPNNVKFAFGSQALHIVGQDLLGGLMDEVNFSPVAGNKQPAEMFRATSRRILSRFPERPGLGISSPGLLFLVSSNKDEEDFLEEHIRETQGDRRVKVVSYSLWEAKGMANLGYSGKMVRVIVGDDKYRSRVLEDDEVVPGNYRAVEVPVELEKEFRDDPETSLMDLAGVSIKSGGHPMLIGEKLHAAVALDTKFHKGPRPFPTTSATALIGLDIDRSLEAYILTANLVEVVDFYRRIYRPLLNPERGRFIHLDPADSGSYSYGFAMGHIFGRKEVKRIDRITRVEYTTYAPIIYIDLIMQIDHPPGDEIDLAKVRSLIFFLKKHGFPIEKVTSDQYQSHDTLQILKKQGIGAGLLSLDKKPENYNFFRRTVHEGRLMTYAHPVFIDEAVHIQVDNDGFVTHLPKRKKDTCDAVAGVCASIMVEKGAEFNRMQPLATPETMMGKGVGQGNWLVSDQPYLKKKHERDKASRR